MHPLLQEKYANTGNEKTDAWRVLVVSILLNQTTGHQVMTIIDDFFSKWPNPARMAFASEENVLEVVKNIGFGNRRSEYLVSMSKQFMLVRTKPLAEIDVTALRGCGEYAHQAWRMFVLGERDFQPKDWELRKRMRELNGEIVDWEAEDIRHRAEKKQEKEEKDEKVARVLNRNRRRDDKQREKTEAEEKPKSKAKEDKEKAELKQKRTVRINRAQHRRN